MINHTDFLNKHLQRECDTINYIPETERWKLVIHQLALLTWKTSTFWWQFVIAMSIKSTKPSQKSKYTSGKNIHLKHIEDAIPSQSNVVTQANLKKQHFVN